MKVQISFTVSPSEEPNHHVDARLSKIFDVDWSGRPMLGEEIELDIGHPAGEESFKFAGAYWNVEPSHDGAAAWFWLERVVVAPEMIDWRDGFQEYAEYAKRKGWEVSGGYGPLGLKTAADRDAAAT